MESGIYKITCLINNLVYVGYSVDIKKREKCYINNNIPNQKFIRESIKKYGWINHKFEIIEYCDKESLKEKEIHWILHYDSYNNGLNGNKGGGGPITHTEETRNKISEKSKVNLGKRKNSHWKGKKKSKEICDNNKANKGKRAISHRKGKKLPEEHRLKLLGKNKGKPKPTLYKPILQYDLKGNFIKEWSSIIEAALFLNCNSVAINNALLKTKNKKISSSNGFIWRYKK